MDRNGKRELAAAFEKLAQLFDSGVPVLPALEVAAEECGEKTVADALRDMRKRAETQGEKGTILPEGQNPFPKSVQMLWRAGEKAREVSNACHRIVKVLKTELAQ